MKLTQRRAYALVAPAPGLELYCSERLEGQDRVRPLDARDRVHIVGDEAADIDVILDVEFRHQVELSADRIDFGRDLAIGDFIGHRVGLAKFALKLHEKTLHRRSPFALPNDNRFPLGTMPGARVQGTITLHPYLF